MSIYSYVCCKVSVHILCPLLNGLVCFFPVNLFEFFVKSGYQPFVRWVNYKTFFRFCWFRFTLVTVSLAVQKLWSFIRSHLSFLDFVANAFVVLFMKSLPTPMSWMVLPRFPSRVFMVPGLMFKSLIHLELF